MLLQEGEVRWITAAEAVRVRVRRVRRFENCILVVVRGVEWEVEEFVWG